MPQPARCLFAVIEDLLFRSKVEAAAASRGIAARVVTAKDALSAATERSWPLVLIDLQSSTSDPLQVIAELRGLHPTMPIVGYCAHGQLQLRRRAAAAGCTAVLPRSTLVQSLPRLLADVGAQIAR